MVSPIESRPVPSPPELQRPVVATVLLGGAVRPTSFGTAIQRSFLDLPLDSHRTLLQTWCDQIAVLADQCSTVQRTLRILTDQSSTPAPAPSANRNISVQVDRDPSAWRGTGGVLRDIAVSYDPEAYILVANAAQVLLAPLDQLLVPLVELDSDLAMIGYSDGSPVTFMLVRCGCLCKLPEVGFLDMKEQALPLIAKDYKVRVATLDKTLSYGIRTADTYIAALQALAHGGSRLPLSETWRSSFQIVEASANVDPSARLHDSVVLRGATIGSGAILVRSVVCPGAHVAPNAVHVDRQISTAGEESTSEDAQ